MSETIQGAHILLCNTDRNSHDLLNCCRWPWVTFKDNSNYWKPLHSHLEKYRISLMKLITSIKSENLQKQHCTPKQWLTAWTSRVRHVAWTLECSVIKLAWIELTRYGWNVLWRRCLKFILLKYYTLKFKFHIFLVPNWIVIIIIIVTSANQVAEGDVSVCGGV